MPIKVSLPSSFSKKIQKDLKKILGGDTFSKSTYRDRLNIKGMHRYINRTLKRKIPNFKQSKYIASKELDELITLSIEKNVATFKQDKITGNFDSKNITTKSVALSQSISTLYTQKITNDILEDNGYNYWVWDPSSASTPSVSHQTYYGLVSKIGETPDKNGEVPGSRFGCQCDITYLNRQEAIKMGYKSNDRRYKAKEYLN